MAKVKFNSQRAANDLFKQFNRVKKTKVMNDEIVDFLVERIKGEARRGRPLNNGRKFKALKSLTIENRRRLANFNKTHPAFAPTKSNLTFSGQLINAVSGSFERDVNIIEIAETKRTGYKTGPRSRDKNPPTNKELQQQLLKISKSFAVFTDKGIRSDPKITKRIKNIVLRFLRRSLRR